jgi:hypothetical protein
MIDWSVVTRAPVCETMQASSFRSEAHRNVAGAFGIEGATRGRGG